MTAYAESINRHYGASDLSARILESLRQAGKSLDALSRDDFTAFDEFHGGGRHSTRELARLAGLRAGVTVLDIGSGVGGPARTLHAEFGCRVTGIDLTATFCLAARMLTELVGLGDGIAFVIGDAVDMPFEDDSFDVAWSQNMLMNIEHKSRLFREVARVLRPGGVFAFETVLVGDGSGLHYPVFWTGTPELNFLVTAAQMRALLASAGLEERRWDDMTARSMALARKRIAATGSDGPATLGLGVIVAQDVAAKRANALRNNEEGRTVAVQAVYVKPSALGA